MATPYGFTEDGFEQQFGVNHLAHFLLINLLLPTLQSSSTPSSASRIVQVASSGHGRASVDFSVARFTPDEATYDPWVAYGQSKTAMIWTANYIERTYGTTGVHAHSLNPGGIWSNLQTHLPDATMKAFKANPKVANIMQTPEQGASTQVWAATAKGLEGLGGRYLTICSEAPQSTEKQYQQVDDGYGPHTYDDKKSEERLWKESLKLVGLAD